MYRRKIKSRKKMFTINNLFSCLHLLINSEHLLSNMYDKPWYFQNKTAFKNTIIFLNRSEPFLKRIPARGFSYKFCWYFSDQLFHRTSPGSCHYRPIALIALSIMSTKNTWQNTNKHKIPQKCLVLITVPQIEMNSHVN